MRLWFRLALFNRVVTTWETSSHQCIQAIPSKSQLMTLLVPAIKLSARLHLLSIGRTITNKTSFARDSATFEDGILSIPAHHLSLETQGLVFFMGQTQPPTTTGRLGLTVDFFRDSSFQNPFAFIFAPLTSSHS
jgi:hypothetical protein